ncbi:DnaB-like helicase C-terminal domain-containing protein [Thermodesulfobacteriota bacterium B35]
MTDPITRFYQHQLPEAELKNNILTARCPFCAERGQENADLVVSLNPESYFHGYFRCLNFCVPGGFPLHFARLLRLDLQTVPGFDPDRDYATASIDYPLRNINSEILEFMDRMTDELRHRFRAMGVGDRLLARLRIGYNGRYLVYPYIQADGNCYSARCVHPDRPEDTFWHGNESFSAPAFRIFNSGDIRCCENGSLIITEGEESLLAIKQLGLPVIAVPAATDLEHLDTERFTWLRTIFLWLANTAQSHGAARTFATRLGYKVRLISWPTTAPRNSSPAQLAVSEGTNFRRTAFSLIREARSFSPFSSPEREHLRFMETLEQEAGQSYQTMRSGFTGLDRALGGIHGINIMGGTPKAGKSCFFIQIATEMARRRIPVIYYDFENGRQKIYLRTVCRLARLSVEEVRKAGPGREGEKRLRAAQKSLQQILPWFRVVTDRALSPEIMRRHIDFLRHETNSDYTLVVIDSLHKLPFKNFSERRTGIDAWLRQLEAIRDELGVSFLVISELSRGRDGQYDSQPQLGSFKGSGDIEYSADNALVFLPRWDPFESDSRDRRANELWLVASREQSPGLIATYRLEYPYWGFTEEE